MPAINWLRMLDQNDLVTIPASHKPVKSSTPVPTQTGTATPVDDDGIRAHLHKLDKKLQQVMDVLKSEPLPGV